MLGPTRPAALPWAWARSAPCIALLSVAVLGGCASPSDKAGAAGDSGGGGEGGAATTSLTYYADVAPIFAKSCDGCHGADSSSGIQLDSAELAQQWAGPIGIAVADRQMPPWTAAPGCNEYEGDFSLSDAELDTVVAWAEGGAPIGDPATAAALPPAFEPAKLDRVDVSLELNEPYTPAQGPDDYHCFLVDWPYTEDAWVTGYDIQPTNLAIAHHVITFLIPPEDVATYEALDAAEPGEGYTCYGGPGGDIDSLQTMRWLGSWAPGGGASVFAEGTGLRVRPGSKLVQQVHYNTLGGGGADQTRTDLRVETDSQGWADIQPWTDVRWVLGVGMEIPAQTSGVSHEFRYTAGRGDTFAVHTGALHMHTMGRSARFSVEHADGSESCIVQEDNWDFNWQRTYQLKQPVNVSPGDTLVLRCTWDNLTDADAAWGEGTGDEMCLATSYLTDSVP